MRIVLADDHRIVRQCLRLCLDGLPDVEVAGEASSGPEALELIRACRPDVAVLDITMPGLNGIEVARQVRDGGGGCRVVVLTMHASEHTAREALSAGASAYVVKTGALDELILAIQAVREGGLYVSPDVASVLAQPTRLRDPSTNVSAALSDRELQVLRAIAEGGHTKGIAHVLGVSDKAVHSVRARLMRKLGVASVADLTKAAIRLGLTDLP
jgi:DNA-binding NarL/FixJ family response regulator